jgi:CheY-like chemotaxis protein
MDGFDFRKERMKDVRLSSVPTVVLTSSNAPRDRRMAMELGADLFILKPDRMDEAGGLVLAWSVSLRNERNHGLARDIYKLCLSP